MEDASEAKALNSIADELNVSKQNIIFKKASYKVKEKLMQHYQNHLRQYQENNKKIELTVIDHQKRMSILFEYLNGLRAFTITMEDCKANMNQSLYEEKQKNGKYQELCEKTTRTYNRKWNQRKEDYESKHLALERKALQNEVNMLKFRVMNIENVLDHYTKAKRMYETLQKIRTQNMVINFAQFMVDSKQKQVFIKDLQSSIAENKLKCDILFQQVKVKMMHSKSQYSPLCNELVSPSADLVVKLNFMDYNLPDPQIKKKKNLTEEQGSESKYFVSSQPQSISPMNIEMQPKQSSSQSKTQAKQASKDAHGRDSSQYRNENLNKYGNEAPRADTSKGSQETKPKEKNENMEKVVQGEVLKSEVLKPEERKLKNNIKIKILQDRVLKSEERFKNLKNIEIGNKNVEILNIYDEGGNKIKINAIDKVLQDRCEKVEEIGIGENIESQQLSGSIRKSGDGKEQMKKVKFDTPENLVEPNSQIINESPNKFHSSAQQPIENLWENIKKCDEIIENKSENSEAYLKEKELLLRELREKYNMKSPECRENTPPSTDTTVSKFFHENDFKNHTTDKAGELNVSKIPGIEEYLKIPPKIPEQPSQPNREEIPAEYPKTTQPVSRTLSKLFGTQKTYLSVPPSISSFDIYSEFGDDSSMMTTEAELSILTKGDDLNVGKDDNTGHSLASPAPGFGDFEGDFNLFGEKSNVEKDKQSEVKESKNSGFNFLFGKSEEKDKKSNFFNLFN